MRTFTTALAALALAAAAPLLTGCTANTAEPAKTIEQTSAALEQAEQTVTITDGWAKAGEKDGMTGVFGTIENHGEADLTITGLASDQAGSIELHEVVDGVMQKIEGEVTIPAGGSIELAPGQDHIMLMQLNDDLLAGDDVAFQLTFDDGSTADLTVLVKDYSGAQEDYADVEGGTDHDHEGSDHSSMDDEEASH